VTECKEVNCPCINKKTHDGASFSCRSEVLRGGYLEQQDKNLLEKF
jgi:hypothetical protein